MDLLEPFFMSDDTWYYYDEKECMYKLTDKAPERARKSYEDFYDVDDLDYSDDIAEVDYVLWYYIKLDLIEKIDHIKAKIKGFFKRFRKK